MIAKGTFLKVQTKTLRDVFGVCIYEIVEDGLPFGERADGVKCVMLGGSGPSAHRGRVIMDTVNAIERNIEQGVTVVIPEAEARKISGGYVGPVSRKTPKTYGTGIELD